MNPIRQVHSRTLVLAHQNIDTDRIIPARFLTTTERSGLGRHAFQDWRYRADGSPDPDFVLNRPEAQGCEILVAGRNFGCGSSREHAPWGLQDYGFRAVVAPSFADIFYSNCTKIGLLPVVLSEEDCQALAHAGEGEIDLQAQEVRFAGRQVAFEIDHEIRRRLLEGLDDIAATLAHEQEIAAYERSRDGRTPPLPLTTTL